MKEQLNDWLATELTVEDIIVSRMTDTQETIASLVLKDGVTLDIALIFFTSRAMQMFRYSNGFDFVIKQVIEGIECAFLL